ncbi:response regulator [Escherichia coli]|uniref:hypothetical protein n=1 Tax=Escherichia coli TaxID=562 RepID=UPI004067BA60
MIKLLIIEDDLYKSNAISEYLRDELNINNITCRESLSSGVFEVLDNPDYDLILLDMSMSTYDISDKDPVGGIPESFAGEDFLAQMELLGYKIPILVVTQYDTFGAGDDSFPLKILDNKLSKNTRKFTKDLFSFAQFLMSGKYCLKKNYTRY